MGGCTSNPKDKPLFDGVISVSTGEAQGDEEINVAALEAKYARRVDEFFERGQTFGQLKEEHIRAAKKFLRMVIVEPGGRVTKMLDPSDSFYVVVSGEVRLSKGDEGHLSVRVVKRGGTFGEVGFFFQTKRTFQAHGGDVTTVLLELSRKTYKSQRKAPWFRFLGNLIELKARQMVITRLRNVDLLQNLDEDRLSAIARLFAVKVVTKGETMMKQGAMIDSMCVVGDGEVVATLDSSKGIGVVELKVFRKGASFGSLGLLSKRKSVGTYTAVTNSTLFTLSSEAFKKFLHDEPMIRKSLEGQINDRLALENLAKSLPFTQTLSPDKLDLLASVSTTVTFPPHRSILTQNHNTPASFFILHSGSVEIIINGKHLKTLDERGAYFGELSLVSNKPHSATVRAGPDGARCVSCAKQEFDNVFNNESGIYAETAIRVLGKNADLAHFLSHAKGRNVFISHCAKEFTQENVDFFLAVEEIERMGRHQVRRAVLEALGYDIDEIVAERLRELREKVEDIRSRFIDPDGAESINIPGPERQALSEALDQRDLDYNVFSAAKKTVFELLESDSFGRFRQSKAFETFLQDLGVYVGNKEMLTHLTKANKLKKASTASEAAKNDINNVNVRDQIV